MSRLTGQTVSPPVPENNSIVAAQLTSDSITTTAIANNAVTPAKIIDFSMITANANVNLGIPAGATQTNISWNQAGASVIGSAITLTSASTFSFATAGKFQVIVNASLSSPTANTRGLLGCTLSGGMTVAGIATNPLFRAVRLGASNINIERTWVFVMQVLTPGSFTVGCAMANATTLFATNTSVTTSTTTSIQILEIP